MFRRAPKPHETEKQYMARVGCLNCDHVQDIMIDKGTGFKRMSKCLNTSQSEIIPATKNPSPLKRGTNK